MQGQRLKLKMKTYHILAIKNKGVQNVEEKMYQYRQWLIDEFKKARQDVSVEIEYKDTDIPLVYKVVLPKNERYPFDLMGLDGIKEKLRGIISADFFHIVIFFYKPDPKIKGLVNLTYPNPIHTGEVYIEVCSPTSPSFEVIRHEGLHALHRLAVFNGITITHDDLDLFGNDEPARQYRLRFYGKIDGINGDEENLKRLRPFYPNILAEPAGRKKTTLLIEALTKIAGLLQILLARKKQTENGKRLLATALTCNGLSLGNSQITYGCAEEVNAVAQKALGVPIGGGVSTARMRDALQNTNRFLSIKRDELLGGEIVISATGTGTGALPNGHVGIYVGTNNIMSNDSSTGLFVHTHTLDSWYTYYTLKGGYPMEFYRVL